MAKDTEVILIKHVKGIGALGDRVKVKGGFARNFLIPQGFALYVNEDSLFRFKSLKDKEEKRLSEMKGDAEALASKIAGQELSFSASTHHGGKLYGSISPSDIVAELKTVADVTVDKRLVTQQDGLRQIGEYDIEIELHPEVKPVVKVTVLSDTEDLANQALKGEAPAPAVTEEAEASEEVVAAEAEAEASAEETQAEEVVAADDTQAET